MMLTADEYEQIIRFIDTCNGMNPKLFASICKKLMDFTQGTISTT